MSKRKQGNEESSAALIERLVDNALDFLARAIDEFQNAPKYSVIHFSAAVGQFLKARLMAEHWSLVVTDRQQADWDKFKSGEFQSVTLDEAASKLEKVVRSPLSADARAAFGTVANHRNRAIHFFHSAHTDAQAQRELQKIAKEQLVAWFYLHRLLQNDWSNIFDPWLEKVDAIEEKLKAYRDFLVLVFEEVKPALEEYRKAGASIEGCDACGFDSMLHDPELNILDLATCMVCGHTVRCVTIECPECHEPVRFKGEGFTTCKTAIRNWNRISLPMQWRTMVRPMKPRKRAASRAVIAATATATIQSCTRLTASGFLRAVSWSTSTLKPAGGAMNITLETWK